MSRVFRGLGAALISVALTATVSPAVAKPAARPGAVSNIAVSATKSGSTFAVASTWTAAARATRYGVRLSAAGVTLDSGSVTTTSWTGHTTVADGTTVTVTVTSFNGTRKGPAVSKNFVLPDLTKPVASYSVSHDPAPVGPNVTVTADSLSDNVSAKNALTQTINWGDGTPPVPWNPNAATISHSYPDLEGRYEAQVSVEDEAGNVLLYPLVIVVNDASAPTGSFALSTPTAWALWTKVSVAEAAIHDNWTPDDKIARVISWGDGAQTVWTPGTTPTHQYATAGSYSPTVVLTDEAGNSSSALPTSTVVVSVDAAAPRLTVTVPAARKSVRAWRTLRGTAADSGVGVRNVVVKAIEKRGTAWYAYKANTRSWVKAGTKARALRQATLRSVRPTAAGAWSAALAKLTKGTLVVQARAFDQRGNASAWVVKQTTLTKR